MAKAFKSLEQSQLSLKLVPISIRDLLYLGESPCDVYKHHQGMMVLALSKYSLLNKQVFEQLIKEKHNILFVQLDDRQQLVHEQQKNLNLITRSLSMGDPVKNAVKQMDILTILLKYLYQNAGSDDSLTLHHQGIKNLGAFLLQHNDVFPQIYHHISKRPHYFLHIQPLLSSILVLAFLKHLQLFSSKDIEQLFTVSYFKDIGMSNIPQEKLEKITLSAKEKNEISLHSQHSLQILQGRIPLTKQQMNIIKYHHQCIDLIQSKKLQSKESVALHLDKLEQTDIELLMGVEILMVAVMDTITAMIANRPYRPPINIFEALEHVKKLMSEKYPHEFKHLVLFMKNIFHK